MGLGSVMVSSSYGPIVYFGLRWSAQAIFIRINAGKPAVGLLGKGVRSLRAWPLLVKGEMEP